jgi:hypothetical protein
MSLDVDFMCQEVTITLAKSRQDNTSGQKILQVWKK